MIFISPPSRLVDLLAKTRYLPPPPAWDDYRGVTTFRGVTLAKRRYFILKETGGGKLRVDFRSWPLVIVIGLILAVLSIIDRGGLGEATSGRGRATACTFTVNGEGSTCAPAPRRRPRRCRSSRQGETVVATTTVTNGFRQMVGGTWVLDGLLTPVPDSLCT